MKLKRFSGEKKRGMAKENNRAFYSAVLRIAVPVILQNLITIGVNMVDTLMLGQYGETQLSGSSLANEFITIFQILCMGMGGGAAVLTAQYWGAKDLPSLRKAIAIMLRFCLMIAGAFTVAVLCFPSQIMGLYTPDPLIVDMGTRYFRYSAYTFILSGVSLTLMIILKSIRQMKVPLFISIAAFSVNVFCNWVFIFGHLGMPEMQIEGAALGTLIARGVECLLVVWYVFCRDKQIGFRVRHLFQRCGDLVRVYFRYSLPVICSDGLLALGNSLVAVIGGHIGAAFVSANAVISQVVRMSTVFNQGISQASSTLTGNTLGEGDCDRAFRQGKILLRLSFLAGLVASGIILLVTPAIIGQYSFSAETMAVAEQLTAAVALMVVFQTLQGVTTKGILRGGGDTMFLVFADVFFLWFVSVPLGYMAALVWHLPPFVVYIALKSDYILKSMLCIYRFYTRKWMRRVSV